jgi:hypothetical protein
MVDNMSPEFMGTVRLQTALMGLTLAFKEKYGDETFNVTKAYVERMGGMIGSQMKEKGGVVGSDAHAIEQVYHAWLDPAYAPNQPDIQVNDNIITVTRKSPMLCPAMVAAKQMSLPLDLVCETVAIPMFRGVAKAVNKNAVHTSIRSQQKCIDKIQIPK